METIFKCLGDENRLRILNILMTKECCVCEIEALLDLTQSNVSRHLSKLKACGIITSTKDAQWIHYNISKEFKEEHANLFSYLKSRLSDEQVFIDDLNRYEKYKTKNLTCVNIREDKAEVMELIK